MARKDVERYYEQCCKQYHELVDNLHEFERLASEQIVEDNVLESIKSVIAPIKDNFEKISYFMFLLNKPTENAKREKYKNINKKLVADANGADKRIKKENEESIKAFKKSILKKGEENNECI